MSRISTDVEYHKSAGIFLLLKIKHQETAEIQFDSLSSFPFNLRAKDISVYLEHENIQKVYFFVFFKTSMLNNVSNNVLHRYATLKVYKKFYNLRTYDLSYSHLKPLFNEVSEYRRRNTFIKVKRKAKFFVQRKGLS